MTRSDDDLIVAYGILDSDSATIHRLLLHRNAQHEELLDPADRGVMVSDEASPDMGNQRSLLRRFVVSGAQVDIHTDTRHYRLDVSGVDPKELAGSRKVLMRMHRLGGFVLEAD